MAGETRQGLRFRPRARLMNTLGRELISSEVVALAELVKNAYDADAGCVLVNISGEIDSDGAINPETGCISVLDDGHGMDEDCVVGAWLEPATPFRRQQRSKSGERRVLGEKGVGRFAAAKLGDRMEMSSKTPGGDEVHLELNWEDFQDETRYLEDVEIGFQVGATSVFSPGGEAEGLWRSHPNLGQDERTGPASGHGTLIKITNLTARWNSDLISDLQRSLAMLVSPFAHERGVVDGFNICIGTPDPLGAQVGEVSSADLLGKCHYNLSAEVEENGTATVLLMLKDAPDKELVLNLCDGETDVLRCGPFEMFLYAWDRDPDSMRILGDELGGRKIAKEMLDSASGLSVYRDGFRVLPYGEKGDDWLGLDARRVQNPTMALSNNQIIGYILVSRDENPGLVDQSNREGIVEAPALSDLRRAVTELVKVLEVERFGLRHRPSKKKRERLLETIDLSPLRDAVIEAVPNDPQIQAIIEEAQRELDDHLVRVSEALSRYHRLATLGKLIDMVVHELTQPNFTIKQEATLAIQTLGGAPLEDFERSGQAREELAGRLQVIKGQAGAADTIIRRITPFGGRRSGRSARFEIETAIRETIELLAPSIASAGVTVMLPTTSHQVTIDRVEIQEVLVNLIDNSLYWLGKSRKKVKKIDISVTKNDDDSLSIIVEDSGPGVPDDNLELIFYPYFTTKPDGHGLGLAITGEIVEDYYDGTLELLPPGPLGGARFRATLRKRVS